MFEFSLENGKRQFKDGFYCLIGAVISATILGLIVTFVTNQAALIALTVILSLVSAMFLIFTLIKIIFGAVVYHAERTSGRDTKDIVKDNVEWSRLDNKKTTISENNIKAAKEAKSPISHVYYSKEDDLVTFELANKKRYTITGVNDKVSKWQKLSKEELTKLFYDKLINECELEK